MQRFFPKLTAANRWAAAPFARCLLCGLRLLGPDPKILAGTALEITQAEPGRRTDRGGATELLARGLETAI